MAASKFSQLHRRLLFHWTGPRDEKRVKNREDRERYLGLLEGILADGLRFSKPGDSNCEWVFNRVFEASHRMICFSEWGLGDSAAHSGRYGRLGLGFTRKFVMAKGGRPVVYVPNNRGDRFRKALHRVLEAANEDVKLQRHVDLVASYLKAYHLPRSGPGSETVKKDPTADATKDKKSKTTPRTKPDDLDLKIDFGGVYANLEDREWRILEDEAARSGSDGIDPHLLFQPGQLAMIVFPDHQTLTLAMRRKKIIDWIIDGLASKPARPAVCLISQEMVPSM